jgi:hypothetical protein
MNLSLVIQLFHKAILFNTTYGPFLNYFLVASSSILDEDDDDKKDKFIPIKANKRLVDTAELTTYSIDEYKIEILFLLGFYFLRMLRLILEKCVFAKWETKYGKGIYRFWKMKKERETELRKELKKQENEEKEKTDKKEKKENKDLNLQDGSDSEDASDNESDQESDEKTSTSTDAKTQIKQPMEQFEVEKVVEQELEGRKENGFILTIWRRILIKVYSTTYILEYVLICRLLADIVLHTSYNILNIDYKVNKKTDRLVFNHVVSFVALSMLIFELCRFIMINYWFAAVEVEKLRRELERQFKWEQMDDDFVLADVDLDDDIDMLEESEDSSSEESDENEEKPKKAKRIYNKNLEDDADDDYNPYEWRTFLHHESAKILMDNFTHFPSISNI